MRLVTGLWLTLIKRGPFQPSNTTEDENVSLLHHPCIANQTGLTFMRQLSFTLNIYKPPMPA
jgi:hypothetical protein